MSNEPRPKIIVDDDWKTQVQKEKESLSQPPVSEPTATVAPMDTASPKDKGSTAQPDEVQLPAPSFALLVSTLVTEALAGLGQIPGPDNQPPTINLPHAKHFIDTLAILEEKTKGNLSEPEAAMLENVLHELRMAFVAVSSRR